MKAVRKGGGTRRVLSGGGETFRSLLPAAAVVCCQVLLKIIIKKVIYSIHQTSWLSTLSSEKRDDDLVDELGVLVRCVLLYLAKKLSVPISLGDAVPAGEIISDLRAHRRSSLRNGDHESKLAAMLIIGLAGSRMIGA